MYAETNPRTKKALKDSIAAGREIHAFSPGPFPCPQNGEVTIEGPHYPEPHRWYARAVLQDGRIVKVR